MGPERQAREFGGAKPADEWLADRCATRVSARLDGSLFCAGCGVEDLNQDAMKLDAWREIRLHGDHELSRAIDMAAKRKQREYEQVDTRSKEPLALPALHTSKYARASLEVSTILTAPNRAIAVTTSLFKMK